MTTNSPFSERTDHHDPRNGQHGQHLQGEQREPAHPELPIDPLWLHQHQPGTPDRAGAASASFLSPSLSSAPAGGAAVPADPWFFLESDEDAIASGDGAGMPLFASGAMPPVTPVVPGTSGASFPGAGSAVTRGTPKAFARRASRIPPKRLLAFAGICVLVVLTIIAFVLVHVPPTRSSVHTTPMTPMTTTGGTGKPLQLSPGPSGQAGQAKQATKTVQPTTQPTAPAPSPTPSLAPAPLSSWVPAQLPAGWTAAGLNWGDALYAVRTAMLSTDREEALDFRHVGPRAQHGGTMTAATFILTPAAQQRFFQFDVRAINNTLFDTIEQDQLIQAAVNMTPSLVQFQVQGGQQLAWVEVGYQLWQAHLDATTGQQVEGLELDPATGQPRVHHMIVVLLRVNPATQGAAAPAGGTGWLVSTYALDPAGGTLPPVIQPA